MPARTIPEPTENDREIASATLIEQCTRANVQVTPEVINFVYEVVEVQAQMAAELRWLYSLLSPENKNECV